MKFRNIVILLLLTIFFVVVSQRISIADVSLAK
jgi:hypothetical protein